MFASVQSISPLFTIFSHPSKALPPPFILCLSQLTIYLPTFKHTSPLITSLLLPSQYYRLYLQYYRVHPSSSISSLQYIDLRCQSFPPLFTVFSPSFIEFTPPFTLFPSPFIMFPLLFTVFTHFIYGIFPLY